MKKKEDKVKIRKNKQEKKSQKKRIRNIYLHTQKFDKDIILETTVVQAKDLYGQKINKYIPGQNIRRQNKQTSK